MNSQQILYTGVGLISVSFLVCTWILIVPSRAVPISRRRWHPEVLEEPLGGWGDRVVDWLDSHLWQRPGARRWAHALDRAGIRIQLSQFIILGGVLAAVMFALGFILQGLFAGFVLVAVGIVGLVAVISVRSGRRKSSFANGLEDVVQFMGTNLRAGHSVVQSVESVAREVEEPTKSELLRVVNQVRIGRDLGDALEETAERMGSEDFLWVAQAVAIHRQVGGNLGEVLDTVSATIRERQQIRRQVKALSAEGRVSALILLALPIFVGLATALLNTEYASRLWTTPIGLGLLAYGSFSMVVGAFWLSKVVRVKF